MRFLQLEWHNHERARNAWDIERAEMKAKIAKQEGDVRSAKKLNDQLDRQIRMLEMALKNERAKLKAATSSAEETPAAAVDQVKDSEAKARRSPEPKLGGKPSKRKFRVRLLILSLTTISHIQLQVNTTTPSSISRRNRVTNPKQSGKHIVIKQRLI
jgi:hypothetical protein